MERTTREQKAAALVDAIIKDLTGRNGLGWDDIDETTLQEIRAAWLAIVLDDAKRWATSAMQALSKLQRYSDWVGDELAETADGELLRYEDVKALFESLNANQVTVPEVYAAWLDLQAARAKVPKTFNPEASFEPYRQVDKALAALGLATDKAFQATKTDPCADGCQYAKDVGMLESSCFNGCVYSRKSAKTAEGSTEEVRKEAFQDHVAACEKCSFAARNHSTLALLCPMGALYWLAKHTDHTMETLRKAVLGLDRPTPKVQWLPNEEPKKSSERGTPTAEEPSYGSKKQAFADHLDIQKGACLRCRVAHEERSNPTLMLTGMCEEGALLWLSMEGQFTMEALRMAAYKLRMAGQS